MYRDFGIWKGLRTFVSFNTFLGCEVNFLTIFSFRLSFLVKYIEIFREDLNSTAYMLSNSHHFIRIE